MAQVTFSQPAMSSPEHQQQPPPLQQQQQQRQPTSSAATAQFAASLSTSPTSASPATDAIPVEPTKLKGRQRLIRSLQRISSSPSLAKMAGRSSHSSNAYNGTGGASMSCVSLSSPISLSSSSTTTSYGHSYGSSYSSHFSVASSNGFSTAPTSLASTPGASVDMRLFDFKNRIRVLDGHRPKTPSSVPLPPGVQFVPLGKALNPSTVEVDESTEDYFSCLPLETEKKVKRKEKFSVWKELPDELRMEVLAYLGPKEIIRASAVSKAWHAMCFDGQLWASLDASDFYTEIPGESLVKIMKAAGPFMKDLNLRGCMQMHRQWTGNSQKITDVCRNLQHFSVEGCKIDRTSVHYFLLRNPGLIHVNLSGCSVLNNSAMRILAQGCQSLEFLNVSWCQNIDTTGLLKVAQSCSRLRDLRASEMKGFDNETFLLALHEQNALERLVIQSCVDFTSDALTLLVQGRDPDIDVLSGIPQIAPRRFKHLDFTRCRQLTDAAVRTLAHVAPFLEGIRLSQCTNLSDEAIMEIIPTCPRLTHLDLEELDLTNATLVELSKAPCAPRLRHLNISYCENLGDSGMIPVIKACPKLRTLEMDNTRVSDLVLVEIAAAMRARNRAATKGNPSGKPEVGLSLVVYDCANVTWTGIREVLSRNAEFYRRSGSVIAAKVASSDPIPSLDAAKFVAITVSSPDSTLPENQPLQPQRCSADAGTNGGPPVYPKEIIGLKCFYGYEPTVREHTRRVLRGELARATLLERKWAEYMIAQEEHGANGGGGGGGGAAARRRRRRLREAERAHADEEGDGPAAGGAWVGRGLGGGRRRARSGGCTIM